ncbi:MAG: small subunit ribosomal protein [Patescibacteria group bacterium]|nr:small subunit ribosomal protein [Patescibacteria group bacterium]
MLIAIKNAGLVKRTSVVIPHSKMKEAILTVLKNEGYIKTYHVTEGEKPSLEIILEYKGKSPRISGVNRVSKVSNRVYKGVKEITPVKYGHGISVFSTPKGIMTDKQARKEMVGGEVLFTIW